ncbi:hypothetical protein [Jiangella anatolica]|uniref:hypothetical protein n=1 Tax=Jiangella anatolica TaxID=2670374 RepID=UPI001314C7D2|nr:hypothetical protein [Jiangella anatolica]
MCEQGYDRSDDVIIRTGMRSNLAAASRSPVVAPSGFGRYGERIPFVQKNRWLI